MRQSVRSRQPQGSLTETFRRNNVVISRRQKEIAERQKSVTQRQVEKKKLAVAKRRKIKVIAVVVVIALGIFGYKSTVNGVTLTSNASTKLTSSQREMYQNAILKDFRAHTLFGQFWLADTAAVRTEVVKAYPEIKAVSFENSAPFSSTLAASVRFRTPVFTWKDASGVDQFVDQDGVLFAKNLDPSVSPEKLIKIEDQSGVVLAEGSSVLTENLVQFVGLLHSKLPSVYGADSSVERVIIPKSTREVHVQMKGSLYIIKLSSTRTIDEQIGELQTLLAYLKANTINPNSYIDLRVPHKAFYK